LGLTENKLIKDCFAPYLKQYRVKIDYGSFILCHLRNKDVVYPRK